MKLSPEAVAAIAAAYEHNKQLKDNETVVVSDRPAEGSTVTIEYTNWRGVTNVRTLIIRRYWHGSTEWHPEPQDLFTGFEPMTGLTRDYAVSGVKSWKAGRV